MNKIIVIYFLIALVFFSIGLGAGFMLFSQPEYKHTQKAPEGVPNTFEAGWEAARKKLEASSFPVVKGETKMIKGRIIEVRDNDIIIEAKLFNPLDDESLKRRVVKVGPDTKIIIQAEKDREAIRREHEEYNKKMEDFRAGKISKLPPVPDVFEQKEGNKNDLKPGQVVTIEADSNIRDAKEFTATKITVR